MEDIDNMNTNKTEESGEAEYELPGETEPGSRPTFDLDDDPGVSVKLDEIEVAYPGMSKETLLKFSQTPFWCRFRAIGLLLFWISWLGLIGAVIGLSVASKKCESRPALSWWQERVVYQIYPRSFKDSDNNGVGDLKGIKSKLDYLEDLGVGIIWLSPIYKSPMADFGYDVSDYTAIDSLFGNMEDFDSLLKAVHDKGLKLIMDFIPNHTSDMHKWFVESRKNDPSNKYRNYYVWEDCGPNGTKLPNNWEKSPVLCVTKFVAWREVESKCHEVYCDVQRQRLSVFGNSSWTFDDSRGKCYLHQFLSSQPDLNLRNNEVKNELDEVLRFWLRKGVDGFRIDAISHLFEDYDLRDEPLSGLNVEANSHEYLIHNGTFNLPGVFEMVARWRGVFNEFSTDDEGKDAYRFMVTESYDDPAKLTKYYGSVPGSGADFPFNFQLIGMDRSCDGDCVYKLVDSWMAQTNDNRWPNWVVGNHDNSRIASKMGENFVNAVNMLLLMLPGTPTTYYGEEIGMTDHSNITEIQDPFGKMFPNSNRDPERTPMQWSKDAVYAGFNDGSEKPWLPVNANHLDNISVEAQEASENSYLSIYKNLIKIRQNAGLQHGRIHYVKHDKNIFAFYREWEGQNRYLVAINFGTEEVTTDFTEPENYYILKGQTAEVIETTHNGLDIKVGDTVSLDSVKLAPGQGVVFKWDYEIPNLPKLDEL